MAVSSHSESGRGTPEPAPADASLITEGSALFRRLLDYTWCRVVLGWCLLFGFAAPVQGDGVVVFNEIMYHPPTNETRLEWVELHNQMSVDVDMSGWSLTGGVGYQFGEGTVIRGGGYLVVGVSPLDLANATGLTNILGPYTGRLSNSGDTLELRNRNNRLMDSVTYGTEGEWPVGPDGGGVSLAKIDEDFASAASESWTVSAEFGGTPGRRNFNTGPSEVTNSTPVLMNTIWRFQQPGIDPGSAWRARDFDDSSWNSGAGLFLAGAVPVPLGSIEPLPTLYSSGLDANGSPLSPGAQDFHYWLTASAQSTPPPPAVPATVIQNHPAWLANDTGSRWLGPVNPGLTDVAAGAYNYRTVFSLDGFSAPTAAINLNLGVDDQLLDILLNGSSQKISYSGFAAFSGTFTITNGFEGGSNSLDFLTMNGGSGPNPAGLRVWLTGAARRQYAANTTLPALSGASYFRTRFTLDSAPALTALKLKAIVADGAVVYLNGTEVLRLNMPAGAVDMGTLAVANVPAPALLGPLTIPNAALVEGANVLAVELHPGPGGGNDALFGAELSLTTTNNLAPAPIALRFNEISPASTNGNFWVELLNYGSDNLELGGCVLRRRGASDNESALPARTLTPGEFLQITAGELGFGAEAGDRLFLYGQNSSMLDAVVAKADGRGRWPDGTGRWYFPAYVSPGGPNEFAFHHEIVINEVIYHAPGLPARPALHGTNMLLGITGPWRYNSLGQDLGTSWRTTNYNDSGWLAGQGLFYNTASVLPAPKNTLVPLANNGVPITTWYFRSSFVWEGDTNGVQLALRPIVDDGAVFYLNGVEVFRTNLPAGQISYTTLADRGVATPAYLAPALLDATSLVRGTNVLAVEVHQFSTNVVGWDVAFGAELYLVGQITAAVPYRESPESWVELFNRSTNTVDLAGWRMDRDIHYTFPSNTTLRSGGYLVLAKDLDFMRSNYPGLGVLGPFDGKMRRSGGHLLLVDPAGNPANEVRFADAKPWPEYADAGGSSLELRDPWADNSKPEAWSASLESHKSAWESFTNWAVAANLLGPTLWNEFQMGLLGPGECLIDDLSVLESPSGTPVQLLQNGDFEAGLTAWRVLGDHRWSRVEVDPDNPANHVLHLVATEATDTLHNHLETTYAGGRKVSDGKEYQVSFRAKWLAGNRNLNTRLYFNRVAKTFALAQPALHGTPGARNSAFTANAGPTFADFGHWPIVPEAGEPVTVSVSASDLQGVKGVTLWWSANAGPWQSEPMLPNPNVTNAALIDGIYSNYASSLPGFPAGTYVQFFVQATDGLGEFSLYPSGGTNSRALFKVSNGKALTTRLHRVRLWMLPADADLLHAHTNVMSNDDVGLTVVYDERVAFYDAGVHLQGSERGRDSSDRAGFTVHVPAGQLLRGAHRSFTIDRSGGVSTLGGRHDEILLWHAVNHAGNIPGFETDLVQVFAPRESEDGSGLLRIADFDGGYFDGQFSNGSDGSRYKMELIYYPTNTLTGSPESPKLPQPDEVINVDIQDRGDDPENYRWVFLQENNAEQDDYRGIVALNRAFSLTGQALQARCEELMDVDEWLRTIAFKGLTGDVDTYTHGLNHNWKIYFRPGDGQALGLLWDQDFAFMQAIDAPFPGTGSPNTYRILSLPNNLRRYYNHLLDLTTTTVNAAHLSPWAAHYAGLLGEDWSRAVSYLQQRSAFVRSFMPLTAAFVISNNNGNNFSVSNSPVILSGIAPLTVKEIQVNGIVYPVTWTSLTNWVLNVPLVGFSNLLVLQGLDNSGHAITSAVDSIVVTNFGAPAPRPVVINEWMADNAGPGGFADPVDGKYQDWFELYNPNEFPVDLSGHHLTDTLSEPGKWTVPPNTLLGAHGFLLVWADNQTNQNGLGPYQDLHAGFQLNNGGEAIALYSPDGVLQNAVFFGAQFQNVSQGLFPDGNTNGVFFLPNWTPRASNQVGAPPSPHFGSLTLQPGGIVQFQASAVSGRTYRLEYKDDFSASQWTALGLPITASGPLITIRDNFGASPHRFYRLVLLQ